MDFPGTTAEQHHAQRVVEQRGPDAVTTAPQLCDAGAEVIGEHFAPLGEELLAAAPRLKLIPVARSGLENVAVAAATAAGTGVVPSPGPTRERSPSCGGG